MADTPFRKLSKPYMIVRGTRVVRASASIRTVDDYHAAPSITERGYLHVGDEVFIMDIVGEVRRAKIDDVGEDEGRASDEGMVFFLEFQPKRGWACPNTVQREVWESWQKEPRR